MLMCEQALRKEGIAADSLCGLAALHRSCEPNCDFHWEPDNAGALCVRALRDVAEGEARRGAVLALCGAANPPAACMC